MLKLTATVLLLIIATNVNTQEAGFMAQTYMSDDAIITCLFDAVDESQTICGHIRKDEMFYCPTSHKDFPNCIGSPI